MAKLLGGSHYWNARYCPWRDSYHLTPWPHAVQRAFKRRQRARERSQFRRMVLEETG